MSVKVFVSSTFTDLKRHRARAVQQLRNLGLSVHPMEDWPADSREPVEFCPERVRDCGLCVLLVGFRRGWVPDPGGADRSITQMEYEEARRLNIPVLPFLLADDVSDWPAQFDDRETDPDLPAWRDRLRPRAGAERFHFRTDPVTLDVGPAVGLWRAEQENRERLAGYLQGVRAASGLAGPGGPTADDGARGLDLDRVFVEPVLVPRWIDPDSDPVGWGALLPALEAVARHPRLVVLGDPGAGKSTLLTWVAYHLAADGRNPWKDRLGSPVPVPLVLRDLEPDRRVTWDGLVEAILAGPGRSLLRSEQLTRLLEDGKVLLLLDGLDEVADHRVRGDLRTALRAGAERYPGCRWVMTSRVVGYAEVPFHADGAGGCGLLYVAPFGDTRIDAFARRWYQAREADPARAGRAAAEFVRAVHRDPATTRLARVPNLLALMAVAHRARASLPHGRAVLYEEVAEAYLGGIDQSRGLPAGGGSLRDRKRWLGRVGFELHRRRAAGAAARAGGDDLRSWLAAAMGEGGRGAGADDPDRFLRLARERSGLLVERAGDRFAFAHLSFQDYFAAVHLKERVLSPEWLAGTAAGGAARADLAAYARLPVWREPLQFLFELLGDEAPGWRAALRDAVFGPDLSALAGEGPGLDSAAVLLARLADDDRAGWPPRPGRPRSRGASTGRPGPRARTHSTRAPGPCWPPSSAATRTRWPSGSGSWSAGWGRPSG